VIWAEKSAHHSLVESVAAEGVTPLRRAASMNGASGALGRQLVQNSPSLAVALNWGTGSSFLNALVNALDKLHIVRGEIPRTAAQIEPVDF